MITETLEAVHTHTHTHTHGDVYKQKNRIKFQKEVFSKKNTLALKGIAIIMMIFHHCFRTESLFKGYKVSFFPLGKEFVINSCTIFKICVGIFAFITGYGLILSYRAMEKKENIGRKEVCKWTITRLIKMLSSFWIIAIISYIICQVIDGMTMKVFFNKGIVDGIIKLVINFFGLSDFYGFNNFNSAWWYMSLAVLFIILLPLFANLAKKYGYLSIILFIMIFNAIVVRRQIFRIFYNIFIWYVVC